MKKEIQTRERLTKIIELGIEKASIELGISVDRLKGFWYANRNKPAYLDITKNHHLYPERRVRIMKTNPSYKEAILVGFQCMLTSDSWSEAYEKYCKKRKDCKTVTGFNLRMQDFANSDNKFGRASMSYQECLSELKKKIYSGEVKEKDIHVEEHDVSLEDFTKRALLILPNGNVLSVSVLAEQVAEKAKLDFINKSIKEYESEPSKYIFFDQ